MFWRFMNTDRLFAMLTCGSILVCREFFRNKKSAVPLLRFYCTLAGMANCKDSESFQDASFLSMTT